MGPEIPTPTILVSSSTSMPRRNGRIVMQLDRFMYLGESFKAILEKHKTDPINYNEAMNNDDVIIWQGAMETELEFMYSNGVWDLEEVSEGTKPIGCKWVYKRKRMVDGKVEKYKARLVAKGYSKKPGFDYEKMYQ
ncbi:hypothetical protein VitviT2T_019899 [Vitis vinifera]|uniref:Reverse transcriptase Ty1/copia-type domain-containing protein n=1 Tax=Vitis vinifera TaxID=29760 RepID=A0ABY9D281_VITVI|nr:hypothetical protein VitviT2T_019899 [Vitis vinifera]